MSGAVELLARLHRLGVHIWPHGDRLRFRPKDAVPPSLVRELAERKTELLALLRDGVIEEAPHEDYFAIASWPKGPCGACGGTRFWRIIDRGNWVCLRCLVPWREEHEIELMDLVGEEARRA